MGTQLPLPWRAQPPPLLANVRCGQIAGSTKLTFGMEVGLNSGNFVFDGNPAIPEKRQTHPDPIFGPCLLWPNSCIDQDATWYGSKCRLRQRCVGWGRSSPLKGTQPPVFGSCLLWPNGWMDEYAT